MNLDSDLLLLAENPNASVCLESLALSLALDEYPNLDIPAYKSEIAAFSHGCKLPGGTDLEVRIKAFTRYLAHELGLQGNKNDYYDHQNSYLNMVIDRRLGIPISLSVLAICIGKKIGLRLFGVGLPGHFITMACEGNHSVYFDVFNGGKILSQSDCERLSFKATGEQLSLSESHFSPLPTASVIIRMLTNLKLIYLRKNDINRSIRILNRLRQIAPNDPSQIRDLGVVLLQAGQPSKALSNLESYIRKVPSALEDDEINNWIKQAKKEISNSN
ncbi:MAG: hypothetical protein RL179_2709 [Planctomycetota bacterium]|jgi:regulator of sirC expression with transglutaminase-like and TPR domain